MTEDEAKKKWCPLARYKFAANSDAPSCNRHAFGPSTISEGTLCIASDCMAWRWRTGPDHPNYNQGYCGAFGPPGGE